MKNMKSIISVITISCFALFFACSGTGNQKSEEAVFKTVSMEIEGMTCEMGCKNAIEKKVAKMEGVESISIDFENAVAEINYNENETNPDEVIETIESIGGGLYSAKIILAQNE
jgi:mercuric ion binding protein